MNSGRYDRPADLARFAGFAAPTVGKALWRNAQASVRARMRRSGPPSGVATLDLDPLDTAVGADPFAYYRRMLAGPPVHYLPRRNCWVISHYDHVRAALRATDVLSSAGGVTRFDPAVEVMLTSDEPEHTRLRRIAQPAFTRKAVEGWTVLIEKLADELVTDALAAPTPPDIVESLAVPMPMRVIADFLGIPEDSYLQFHQWSDAIAKTPALNVRVGVRDLVETYRGFTSLYTYLGREFDGGRVLAGDSALGRVARASADGDVTPHNLFFFAVLMLVAGNETTTTMLGALIHNLATQPDQFALLKRRPNLVPNAIEETVRHSTPIQCFYRKAVADYRVDAITIPAGARVMISYGAANRDPRKFADPDSFRVDRDNAAQHVGFGHGPHLCMGAQLSRLEGQAVLRELIARVDLIEPAGEPVWTSNSLMRGIARLPVRLVPSG